MSLLSFSLSILPQVSVSRATSEFDSPEIEFLLCFMVSCPVLSPSFTLSNLSLLSLSLGCVDFGWLWCLVLCTASLTLNLLFFVFTVPCISLPFSRSSCYRGGKGSPLALRYRGLITCRVQGWILISFLPITQHLTVLPGVIRSDVVTWEMLDLWYSS